MNLKGKTAIITGGAMGIGFATSKNLVDEGCTITIWDLNEPELLRAADELKKHGGNVFAYVCDVTDKKRVAELTEQAIKDMSQVDILINNAGFVKNGFLLDQSVDAWDKTIDVNLKAIIYTTQTILPYMNKNNFGHIVNISSAAGLIGVGGLAVYAATKWAVLGLTESLRFESFQKNIKVKWSSIHPMYLAHGMFEGAKLNFLGRLLIPNVKSHDVIAKAIVNDALKKGKKIVRRPITLRLAILLRGILPNYLFEKVLFLVGVNASMKSFKGRD